MISCILTPVETVLDPVAAVQVKGGEQEAGLLILQYELILFRYEFMILIYYAISYCHFTM